MLKDLFLTIFGLISDENGAPGVKRACKDVNNLPTRQYLDQTIVPILLEALASMSKDRPKDPIDYMIQYLQSHKNEHTLTDQK